MKPGDNARYVSGLSKNVATGLRFGYVVAPTQFVGTLERAIHATTWNTPALITARTDQVAAALMRETISVSTGEPFATTRNVPHAIRLALGSVSLDALADSLHKVRRVIDAASY